MSRNRSGFTLVELLIVVVVLGILVAIALPRYSNTRDKAKIAALRTDLRNAETAEETYYADNMVYADLAQLQAEGLLSLSPSTTMDLTAGPDGYKAVAKNTTIGSATNSCSVKVGAGTTLDDDGVITCP